MILIGIENQTVVLCVSINDDQLALCREMYPDWILQAQVGEETIGWTFNGEVFTAPKE